MTIGTDEPADVRPFAVVTGASSGIGFALAAQFANHGFDLLIAAEDAAIENAAIDIANDDITVEYLQTDLRTDEGVDLLYSAIAESDRALDAIAINAGVGVGGDFRDTDRDDELALIDLNCRSTVRLAKRVVPQMAARGAGGILFTASIASIMPAPFEAVYGASKAFVYSFAEALRNELRDTGVTMTALMPGPTETNFFHRAGMDDTKVGVSKKDEPAEVASQGYHALMAGKDHVIAGSFRTKAQAAVAGMMSQEMRAQAHRGMAQPGSGLDGSADGENG